MKNLPQATIAADDEVLHFIESHALFGTGIGYIDAHLLSATRLSTGALLWTRDKRLLAMSIQLGLSLISLTSEGALNKPRRRSREAEVGRALPVGSSRQP